MAQLSYLPPLLTVEVTCSYPSIMYVRIDIPWNGRRIPYESSIPLLFSDMAPVTQKHWFFQSEW